MAVSIDYMRKVVSKAYSDKEWPHKVARMQNSEIVKLYMRLNGAKRFNE